jgi:hypothetical protein
MDRLNRMPSRLAKAALPSATEISSKRGHPSKARSRMVAVLAGTSTRIKLEQP